MYFEFTIPCVPLGEVMCLQSPASSSEDGGSNPYYVFSKLSCDLRHWCEAVSPVCLWL